MLKDEDHAGLKQQNPLWEAVSPIDSIASIIRQAQVHVFSHSVHYLWNNAMNEDSDKFGWQRLSNQIDGGMATATGTKSKLFGSTFHKIAHHKLITTESYMGMMNELGSLQRATTPRSRTSRTPGVFATSLDSSDQVIGYSLGQIRKTFGNSTIRRARESKRKAGSNIDGDSGNKNSEPCHPDIQGTTIFEQKNLRQED